MLRITTETLKLCIVASISYVSETDRLTFCSVAEHSYVARMTSVHRRNASNLLRCQLETLCNSNVFMEDEISNNKTLLIWLQICLLLESRNVTEEMNVTSRLHDHYDLPPRALIGRYRIHYNIFQQGYSAYSADSGLSNRS